MSQERLECAFYGCSRNPLESSKDGRCIFHAREEEKDAREFDTALRNYISEAAEVPLPYIFEGFVFVSDFIFWQDVPSAEFMAANFRKAEFHKDAIFDGIVFRGYTTFWETRFLGKARFEGASFQGQVTFRKANFQKSAYFLRVHFQGTANFEEAKFHGEAAFSGTEFGEHTSFDNAEIERGLDFVGVEFRKRASISPKFIKGESLFIAAVLDNISLSPLNLDKNASIDFTNARLRNTEIKQEDVKDHIIQEREENFLKAKEIYLLLKSNFHGLGRYDDESWAFLREKEMERRDFWWCTRKLRVEELGEKWKNRGLKDCFYPVIFYSGRIAKYLWDYWLPTSWKSTKQLAFFRTESFRRPLVCVRAEFRSLVSSLTISEEEKSRKKVDLGWKEILKALLFYPKSLRYKAAWKYFNSTFLKWLYEWGENPWRILGWCIVIIFVFSGLYYLIGDIAMKENLVKSYGTKLYFSGITFTTLGFGGYSPMGWARVLAFIESFLGIFSIALFVYSFARRTAGR